MNQQRVKLKHCSKTFNIVGISMTSVMDMLPTQTQQLGRRMLQQISRSSNSDAKVQFVMLLVILNYSAPFCAKAFKISLQDSDSPNLNADVIDGRETFTNAMLMTLEAWEIELFGSPMNRIFLSVWLLQ
ncbi:hypothetical protein TNCT_283841 [Trichonephila clavata]|uniref:Uncharacterized protein n=1 Tax=Trichonephila clavata TaxID=2740835 RepID=A0A8X6JPP6_TRICU|nr:hypothetical protein TNCT_283841 [Trichonephila clavata]